MNEGSANGNGSPKSEKNDEMYGTAVECVGGSTDARMAAGEGEMMLTTRQGHPVSDNQNTRTSVRSAEAWP